MIKINENYQKLSANYLFAEIANRVTDYQKNNPDQKIIKLGIGDVTEPLVPSVIEALHKGVDDMGNRESFYGYGPYEGYEFLRSSIADFDFKKRGININPEEVFISSGAKEDTANFSEVFSQDTKIAITDPVYPVYIDSNVMFGRTGSYQNNHYQNVLYLDCTADNQFKPDLPKEKVDLIYLCFPNNPTGQVATKKDLQMWVNYAHQNKALILFDAAYEAFIQDEELPHSIFEIDGADEVAVEFRSLSKTAGFTGTRLSYTIIPDKVHIYDQEGHSHQLNKIWLRRQSTKFNGVPYIIQKGAAAVFTDKGRSEINQQIQYYLDNAKIIQEGFRSLDIEFTGGDNSPYIWLKTPNSISSWDFFDLLINQCQVVGTPGAGFGRCGEGYFRLSAFGNKNNIREAMERIKKLKIC
ncbi:MAG: LL-diaminopimelate aminotransferase [Spirochaetes bacterium]|nr:LL-diaminopimelate aminotransferase [Spirochaetota bacterium]